MTPENPRLTLIRRSYVATVVIVGAGVVAHSVGMMSAQTIDFGWVLLALLTLISGSFTVRIPGATSTISVSETFVIIAAVRYGPGPAAVLVALEGLIVSLWILKNSKEVYRVFFNMATGGVSVWLSAHLFFALTPSPLVLDSPASVVQIIPPLFLFASVYFLANSWLIAIAIGLDTGRPVVSVWRNAFVLLSLNYVSGASLAALLLPFIESIGLGTISLIAPLMVLAYVTFRTAMGRIADANSHLSELNKLYLSTIETLAMAIDAKDQITHGHVRRVQAYAIGLARAVGVSSESELKAIEAAALLHDMGKLAIPEHILNKPGKLTSAEFETMKQHANIGADILSAIEFPYPVVPIVRYHHENWDGHGYPEGLSEDDIPIGARILAVVDCFDALTSDRPYRPRLPDTEALQIIRERAGKMYDPALVEKFAEIYRSIAPAEVDFAPDDPQDRPSENHRDGDPPSHQSTLDSISASTGETRMLYELGQTIGNRATVAETAEVIFSHLRRCVPVCSLVLFAYDQVRDQIVARHTSGEQAESMLGIQIGLGQRVSGWVAANRRTALNSDPALDLGDIARTRSPRLLSCLSTAIETSETLVGVVTLYSTQKDAFSDQHSRIVQLVATHAAEALRNRLAEEGTFHTSEEGHIEGIVDKERVQRSFDHARFKSAGGSVSLVVILSRGSGALEGSTVISSSIRPLLRATDELFQTGPEELVVIMPRTDRRRCSLVTEHIREHFISTASLSELSLAGASWPDEGDTLLALVQTARNRLGRAPSLSPKQLGQNPAVH